MAPTAIRGDLPTHLAKLALRTLNNTIDDVGWDQPHSVWTVRWLDDTTAHTTPADNPYVDVLYTGTDHTTRGCRVELADTFTGSPYNYLVGRTWGAETDAVIIVVEAWAVLNPGNLTVRPSEHPDRQEIRTLTCVSRAGSVESLTQIRNNPEPLDQTRLASITIDALRRTMRIPTPACHTDVGELLGRLWAAQLAALASVATLDARDLIETDPLRSIGQGVTETLKAWLDADTGPLTGTNRDNLRHVIDDFSALPQDERTSHMIGQALVEEMGWDVIYGLALSGTFEADVAADLATWFDPPSLARHLLASTTTQNESLDDLIEAGELEIVAALSALLRERGWLEPETEQPPLPEQNTPHPAPDDRCPCGSGDRWADCHGQPAPTITV